MSKQTNKNQEQASEDWKGDPSTFSNELLKPLSGEE